MKDYFQTAAIIEKISTRKDKTIKLVIGTQEIPPEAMVKLFSLKDSLGWFMFSSNEFTKDDVPDKSAKEFKNKKSNSQRIRNALYYFWEGNYEIRQSFPEFQGFYDYWCEKKINEIQQNTV